MAKRATPVFAVFAAVAALVKLAGGPTWALIVFAAIAVVGPVVDWVLKGRQRKVEVREERESLWMTRPARVREFAAGDGFYRLGVETEAREALELAGQSARGHAAYVERDVDELQLRPALRAAAVKREPSLVVLRGPSKAGKSRTLLEVAAHVLPDLWLIAPKDAVALGKLARGRPPPEIGDGACVIWLNDIEVFVHSADEGLDHHTLAAFETWERPVVVLGTAGGKGREAAGGDAQRFAERMNDLLTAHEPIRLSSELSPGERDRLGEDYSPEATRRIADAGIGEYMIAAQRLVARFEEDRECPEGIAVTRAAIDWRRAGLVRPVPAECLQRLFAEYVNGPPTGERFERGLLWASTPLYSHVALIQGNDPYEAYDFLVERAARDARVVLESTWDIIVAEYATDDELATVGVRAYDGGDLDRAEAAYRRADERGHAIGAFNLGVLLMRRGDEAGAEAAYRRADERGGGYANTNLGVLLAERGDEAGAEAAYRRADESGDANGAFNLGVLLEQRGDEAGAEAAYRRADERGSGSGASNLGGLLSQRGDEAGAEAAYRRADERGDAGGAFNLGVVLALRGDKTGEEAAYRRADERGDANGAFNLGGLLSQRGDEAGAEAAYRRADERGQAEGAHNLGKLLVGRGDEAGAEAAYRRADERGSGQGASSLGVLLARRGDEADAEAALRRADERGHPEGTFSLGVLLERRGDEAGAEAAFRRADERGYAGGAFQLGMRLERRGDEAGAEAAFRRADERGDVDGAFNLAVTRRARRRPSGAPTSAATPMGPTTSGRCSRSGVITWARRPRYGALPRRPTPLSQRRRGAP